MWKLVWLTVVASLTVQGPVARAEPPSEVLSYALFGIEQASLSGKTRVEGDVGVLSNTLALGPGTRVTGIAAAPTITLGRNARAGGGFFCATLDGSPDGCTALPNPLVATPAIVVVGPPSNSDVNVARRSKSTSPLSPGTYGALTVGTAAQLVLAGGTYQFESIALASRGKLLCQATCDITVRGRVRVGQATRLGAGEGVSTDGVVLLIAAQDEATAFEAKNRAKVRCSVYAPSAAVTIGGASQVSGALVGNTVTVGPRTRLQARTGQ